MADTMLKIHAPFSGLLTISMGTTAETIAQAGGTIPEGTGEIWFLVPSGDNIRYFTNGATPTTSIGHRATANQWGFLPMNAQGSLLISEDGGDVSLQFVFVRGAGRQD